jgi:hypothetical protein
MYAASAHREWIEEACTTHRAAAKFPKSQRWIFSAQTATSFPKAPAASNRATPVGGIRNEKEMLTMQGPTARPLLEDWGSRWRHYTKEVSVGVSRAENTYAGDRSRWSRREKKRWEETARDRAREVDEEESGNEELTYSAPHPCPYIHPYDLISAESQPRTAGVTR